MRWHRTGTSGRLIMEEPEGKVDVESMLMAVEFAEGRPVELMDRTVTALNRLKGRDLDGILRRLRDYGDACTQGSHKLRALERRAARELGGLLSALARDPLVAGDDDAVRCFLRAILGKEVPDEAMSFIHLLARWGHEGAPSVRASGKQAAALMLSDISDEVLASLSSPWRAFEVVLAEPLEVAGDSVMRVQVLVEERLDLDGTPSRVEWTIRCQTRNAVTFRRSAGTLDLYRGSDPDPEAEMSDADGDFRTFLIDVERRVLNLCARLALNIALALEEDPRVRKGAGSPSRNPAKTKRRSRKRASGDHANMLTLAFPVEVDVREHIADYLRGTVRHAQKLRWVVRGHWRNQPHGPKAALRKRIWISPYWKGPMAPLAGKTTPHPAPRAP